MGNRFFATFALLAVLLLPLTPCLARDDDDDALQARVKRAEAIKTNSRYHYGVGRATTEEEADRLAIGDLCSKISMTVSQRTEMEVTQDSENFTSKGIISTYVRLNNTEKFEVCSGQDGKWEIVRYVEKQQLEAAKAERAEKVKALVAEGEFQERRAAIGGALKYFNWAYALSRACDSNIMLDIDGKQNDAKTWLNAHINLLLNSLQFTLDGAELREGELDPYLVNLCVKYLGEPVGDLDYSYVNAGNPVRNQVVKNGRATLAFSKLPKDFIDLAIDYRYEEACQGYDDEIAAVYAAGKKHVFAKASMKIPCKGNELAKFKISENRLSGKENNETESLMATAPVALDPAKRRIEAESAPEARNRDIIDAMSKVKAAIDNRAYTSVRPLFTTEGYALFSLMMQSGKVSTVPRTDEWRVEMAGDYVVGRSIPVSIKYNGGHCVSEDIVFRFDSDNKIVSVAYALTKRAEDDIFKKNSWDYNARYAILQFMEDYQTAYALKRLEYIKSIFSKDAVIISGKKAGSRLKNQGEDFFVENGYTYTRETRDQYIQRLGIQFPNKKYIKLTFEENEIEEQSGVYGSVFWIQLRQFYQSSDYNDMGYLTLMIDMKKENPQIHVRTWAPGKIPMEELMSRYTQN